VLAVDPVAEARGVPVPALGVWGGADLRVTAADGALLAAALRSGAEQLAGASDADHNLALTGADHEHGNGNGPAAGRRDNEALGRLATWVKTRLAL
jgi:hypothetical protein